MSSIIREKTGRSSEFADVLQLVEKIIVTVDTDVVTFLGLDGDNDGTYIIEAILIAGNNNGDNYHVRPNGSDANCESIALINTGAVLIPSAQAYLLFGDLGPTGSFNYSRGELRGAKTGGLRRAGWATSYRGINGTNIGYQIQWGYADSATNITSLDVFVEGGAGNAIKAGSELILWKLKH